MIVNIQLKNFLAHASAEPLTLRDLVEDGELAHSKTLSKFGSILEVLHKQYKASSRFIRALPKGSPEYNESKKTLIGNFNKDMTKVLIRPRLTFKVAPDKPFHVVLELVGSKYELKLYWGEADKKQFTPTTSHAFTMDQRVYKAGWTKLSKDARKMQTMLRNSSAATVFEANDKGFYPFSIMKESDIPFVKAPLKSHSGFMLFAYLYHAISKHKTLKIDKKWNGKRDSRFGFTLKNTRKEGAFDDIAYDVFKPLIAKGFKVRHTDDGEPTELYHVRNKGTEVFLKIGMSYDHEKEIEIPSLIQLQVINAAGKIKQVR